MWASSAAAVWIGYWSFIKSDSIVFNSFSGGEKRVSSGWAPACCFSLRVMLYSFCPHPGRWHLLGQCWGWRLHPPASIYCDWLRWIFWGCFWSRRLIDRCRTRRSYSPRYSCMCHRALSFSESRFLEPPSESWAAAAAGNTMTSTTPGTGTAC